MTETIFALSSGPGPCGVAVFRVSGPGVPKLVQTLTRGAVPPPRQAVLRSVFDPRSGERIDRGFVLYFSAPHSFTGEDVAEFHLHGAVATIRGFTAALMALEGTRLAEPGEFTQRAFRLGKMSLLEVEALGDLLRAETLEQARLAQRSHHLLARAAAQWREEILTALALTEASIDFSDEDDVAADIDSAAEQHIRKLISLLDQALAGFAHAERIRRGFRVALCGPPNAGKSSLLNALARRDVAIVSPVAGTTRDVIEVHLDLGGYPVVISDTAGIRDSSDMIEREGIERARGAAEEADLVLWLSPEDVPVPSPWPGAWTIASKADLGMATKGDRFISVTKNLGIDALVNAIAEQAASAVGSSDGLLVAHARQAVELERSIMALRSALKRPAELPELRAEDIRSSLRYLDRLVGHIDPDEVLGAIFSRFCIGK